MKNITQKQLEDKARELKREYQREWRRKNRERCAAYQRDHWQKKAAELLAAENAL